MDKQKFTEEIEKLNRLHGDFKDYVVFSEVLYLIKQLDEPQKVVIPQYVADWIEYCKEHNFTLLGCLDPVDDFGTSLSEGFKGDTKKCVKWCRKESNTFALAWLFGYEVMEEKRYIVKVNGVFSNSNCLNYNKEYGYWAFVDDTDTEIHRVMHTKEELIKGGFEWVFSCEGVEVEEVEE